MKEITKRYTRVSLSNGVVQYVTECKCGAIIIGCGEMEAYNNWDMHICKSKKKIVRK